MSRERVLFVGVMPPPVTGMTRATAQALRFLDTGFDVHRVAVSNEKGRGPLAWRLVKHARVLGTALRLPWYRLRGYRTLYMVSESGSGLPTTLVLVAMARLFMQRIVMHHHVYAYVTRPAFLMRLIARVGGRRVSHVLLCDGMRRDFMRHYPGARHAIVLGNAALAEQEVEPAEAVAGAADRLGHDRDLVLGFLSNITLEKGIGDFIAVFRRLKAAFPGLRALVAGPVADAAAEQLITDAVAEFGDAFSHIGAVYGADKLEFFSGIDVLLFPTRYVNEAQPLVIVEALRAEVPVVAYARGCIPDQVSGFGVAVADADAMVSACEALIRGGLSALDIQAAGARFVKALKRRSADELQGFTRQFQVSQPEGGQ